MTKLSAFTLLFFALLVANAAAQTPDSQRQSSQSQDSQAAQKPDESTVHVSQGNPIDSAYDVDPPRLTYSPSPKYPKDARNLGHQGTSILSLVVGKDGRPHDVAIMRPLDPELDDCAIAAVSKWRYQPALRDGEPVEVTVHARIRFRVYNKSYGHTAQLWDRSDSNDPKADLQLWKAYLDGNGVPQDDQLAFEFLKMAADWNFSEAQFLMGEHYYRDVDNAPDYVNAYRWYALSKRAGGKDGEAMLKTLVAEMTPEQIGEADTRVSYWPEDPPKADPPVQNSPAQ
ncbi:MAG: TonB family protein [Terriglobales bacterium]